MSKPVRTVVLSEMLPSKSPDHPALKLEVTATPHAYIPGRQFHEVWVYAKGFTLRTSTALFNPGDRDVLANFIEDLTEEDYGDRLDEWFKPFDWNNNPE